MMNPINCPFDLSDSEISELHFALSRAFRMGAWYREPAYVPPATLATPPISFWKGPNAYGVVRNPAFVHPYADLICPQAGEPTKAPPPTPLRPRIAISDCVSTPSRESFEEPTGPRGSSTESFEYDLGDMPETDKIDKLYSLVTGMNLSVNAPLLERAFFRVIHLTTLRTTAQFITYMVDVISEMSEGSLHSLLLNILHGDSPSLDTQAGEAEPIHEKARKGYGSAIDHFQAMRKTELGARIRKIFALVFMAGMLGKDPEKNYPGIYKRVIVAEGVQTYDGLDITEEIFCTIRTVWDVVSNCITEKSFGPLVGSTVKLQDLQATHSRLMADQEYYLNGTYARVRAGPDGGLAEGATYILELTKHTTNVQEVQKRNKEKALCSTYAQMLLQCAQAMNRVREKCTRVTTRRTPYGALFIGRTGVGKSVVAIQFLRDALRIAGLPFSNEYIAWVNTAEAFMTTITNYTLGVILDDVANTRAEMQKTNELIDIIRISNSACTPVEKADLADKGTVFHNCQVFVATTNSPDLQASKVSIEPSAVLRRFKVHVRVRAKAQFSTQRERRDLPMLDPSKFDAGIYTRSQLFSISTYVPISVTDEQGANPPQGEYRLLEGVPEWVEYGEMMKILAPRIREHFHSQEVYLSQMEADAELPLCPHGATTAPHCVDCASEVPPLMEPEGEVAVQAGEQAPPLAPPPPRPEGRGFWSMFSLPINEVDDGGDEFLVDTPESSPPASVERLVFGNELAARMEAQRSAPQPMSTRLRSWWEGVWNPPAPPPAVPQAVAWWEMLTKGKFPIEDLFLQAPTAFGTCVMGLFPASFAALFTGFVYLCTPLAAGWLFTTYVATTLGCVYTVCHGVYSYATHRIAGMPARELKKHLSQLATRRMAIIMSGVLLAVGTIALTTGLLSRKREKEPVVVAPAGAPVVVNVAAPVPAPLEVVPTVVNSVPTPSRLQEQGGHASVPDPVPRTNEWVKRELRCVHVPRIPQHMTATRDQVMAKLSRQLFNVTIRYEKSEVVTQAWMPVTNYAVMPLHNFRRVSGELSPIKEMVFTITGAQHGASFRCRSAPQLIEQVEGADLAVVYVGVGGTLANLMTYISDAPDEGEVCVEELSRVREGVQDYLVCSEKYRARPTTVRCVDRGWSYPGYIYNRQTPSFQGLCGALLVTAGQFPMVVGMHTMGRDGGTDGRAVRLRPSELLSAIEAVRRRCPDSGPPVFMESTQLFVPRGHEVKAVVGELSEKSLLRETQPGTSFIPLGTLTNHTQNKPRTRLEESEYSDMVTECTRMPRTTAPNPTYGRSVNYKKCVDDMGSITQIPWDPFFLACEDYQTELTCILRAVPDLRQMLRPLRDDEVLSGVVGCASINAMNFSTARGFPFSGNKHSIYEWRNMSGEIFRVPTGEFFQEVEDAKAILRRGERANFVFNSNQKDEAKKIGATTCRVFEACPTPLIYLTRLYFLPIARLFSLFPLQTESAVGINASGPEWDTLARYVMEFSPDVVMAKDWSKFDKSQAYQETKRAFTLLIWVAQTFGEYSKDDIQIMWGLAEDTCRYIAQSLSDLRMNDGSNSSGNALTVIINDIVHSHRDRAAFYALWARHKAQNPTATISPRRTDVHAQYVPTAGLTLPAGYRGDLAPLLDGLGGRFSDYVRASYYGDDSIGGVCEEARGFFNQIAYAQWFSEQGKKVTAADKSEVSSEFGTWKEATFLKRAFRYDAEVGRFMAPLEMASIYKPMHVWPKKQVLGKEVQLATLIDNAARELYQHGRREYELRVDGLRSLAVMANVKGYLQLGYVPEFDHFIQLERDGVPDSAGLAPAEDSE